MTWTIRVLNWKDFQHYKDRDPPWIKLHGRRLLDKPGWRRLHGTAAKLLVDVWMLAAQLGEKGELDMTLTDLAFRVRLSEADVLTDLQVLAQHQFLELCPQLLAGAPKPFSEVETEAEGEERERQSSDTSYPATPGIEKRNPMAVLGPLIREHLYRGKPPTDYDPRRCAHICTQLVNSGRYTVDDLREAILVIPRLRAGTVKADESLRRWFLKQGQLTMRALNDRWGSGSVLEQLLHVVRKNAPAVPDVA